MIIALLAVIPAVVTNLYHIQIMIFIGIYIILTLSLNLLNGYVGLLSIGHAAFYGIGAYASAKLVMEVGLPFPLAMLGAGAVAGIFGYLIAKPTLRLSGIYMTLATLGFNMIFFLILQNWMSFTNGPLGIMDIPPPDIFGYEIETRVQYYYLIFFLVLLTVVSMHRLMTCRFGRALVSIRENELAAAAMGVHTKPRPLYWPLFMPASPAVTMHTLSSISARTAFIFMSRLFFLPCWLSVARET